ncbi:hypothetical protein [Thioalkalivibrio thiocyanoxidans]|nr:hypothetical protein [Thioalkalivibrio thiocyanoxidans]
MEEIARVYDPALHEAPIVLSHPRTDGPVYGGVEAVEYSDPALLLAARPR